MEFSDPVSHQPLGDGFYYIVDFPQYPVAEQASFMQAETRIRVKVVHRYRERPADVTHLNVDHSTQSLGKCMAVVEHTAPNLSREQLVKELLELGCGRNSIAVVPMPASLPCGARLTRAIMLRHDDSWPREYDTILLPIGSGVLKSQIPGEFQQNTSQYLAERSPVARTFASSLAAWRNDFIDQAQSEQKLYRHHEFQPQSRGWVTAASFVNWSSSPASFMTARSTRTSPAYSSVYALSPASFVTARSSHGSPASSSVYALSPASFITARSPHASPAYSPAHGLTSAIRINTIREDEICDPDLPAPLRKLRDDYYNHLHQQKIVLPFDQELNWSDKGQHVTFMPHDVVPLRLLSHLGASMTAKVDRVLCKRVALARKTMRCSRQWSIADALLEVYHLQALRHHHIVQLVGSYLQGREFSILLYPVAQWHLGTFLEDTADMCSPVLRSGDTPYRKRLLSLVRSFACLNSALSYVHDQTTRHMDIKPQNILMREVATGDYRVYLADFGLSRSFASRDHSQTDGPVSRTPRYCAPEVYHDQRHGRAADIFSLGCVFTEIFTVLNCRHPHDFAEYRRGEGHDESFHANLERTNAWLDEATPGVSSDTSRHVDDLTIYDSGNMAVVRETSKKMISYSPNDRPTAREMRVRSCYTLFHPRECCVKPPEQYVAYENASSESAVGQKAESISDP